MSPPEEDAELRHKLISGAKWATALRILTQLISWLVTIVVVRYLTPDDYGLNAMLEVPIELLMLFSTIGLDMALIQKQRQSDEELAASFGMLLLVNGIFFAVLLAGAGLIAQYFNEPRLANLIRVTALVFVLAPFRTVPNALLDRDLAFKLKSQVELAAAVISALLSLVLAVAGAGVWALVGAVLANAGLRAALLMILRPWFIRPTLQFARVGKLLRYGGVITASGAILVMAGKGVQVIAGPTLGVEALGLYAVAVQFAMLPLSRVMPVVQQTLYPAFARVHDRQELACAYFLKGIELSALVIYPMSIGLACVADAFVATFFGAKWLPVVLPLTLISLVVPFRMVTNVYAPALNAMGHARRVLATNIAMFLLLICGTPLAMRYGIVGLACLWVAVNPLVMLLTVILGRSALPLAATDFMRALGPALSASALMALALSGWRLAHAPAASIPGLVAEVGAGAAIYVGALMLFFPTRLRALRDALGSR